MSGRKKPPPVLPRHCLRVCLSRDQAHQTEAPLREVLGKSQYRKEEPAVITGLLGPFFSQLKQNGIFSQVVLCHQEALWTTQSWGVIYCMENKERTKIIYIPPWSRCTAPLARFLKRKFPSIPDTT